MPTSSLFGPVMSAIKDEQHIIMSIDEYETIRLIDLRGYTQEECAIQMKVARTTIQAIYNEARKKLASSLVNGIYLRIYGGDVQVCNGTNEACVTRDCKNIRKED